MRVLILGGSGFLGPQIAARLAAAGHEVSVFCRTPPANADFPAVYGDRNRLMDSAAQLRSLRPDAVVDAIAFTERQAQGLVEVFRGHAGRVVVLSSGDVYRANDLLLGRVAGPVEPTPLTEASPLRDRLYPYRGAALPFDYGFSWDDYDKILVERAVMNDARLAATILRLPMVYGPGPRDLSLRRFFPYLKRMDDGRAVIPLHRSTAVWKAPWGYSGDIAEAVRLAVENERAAGEIFNVADARSGDLQTWVRDLGEAARWNGEVVAIDVPCPPPSFPAGMNLNQHLDMDSGKIRRMLGYRELMARGDALRKTIAWERTHWPAQIDPAQFDYATEDEILARRTSNSGK